MVDERRLDTVALEVDGSPVPPELYDRLTLVRAEESCQLPDEFMLRFDDPYFEMFDNNTFRMGSTVAVSFRSEGELLRVSNGEVTSITIDQPAGQRHQLMVQGHDLSHRLARGSHTRTFVQMSDADIVSQIASDYGMSADVAASGEVHEYVLQASQSDYAFLSERAQRNGFDLWVAEDTLHFQSRPQAASQPAALKWGDNLTRFRVRFSSADRCDEMTVRGWDAAEARAIVGRASGQDGRGTTARAAAEMSDDARGAFGQTSRFAGQFPVNTQGEADALAAALLQRSNGSEVIARGEATGDPRLAAGAEVEFENLGERLSGLYTLTSVEHVFGSGTPYVTRFVAGGRDAGSIVELLGGGSSASAAGTSGATGGHQFGGLSIGVVTNCDDPDGMARVKVSFPTLSEDDESTWARVAGPGAGEERGFLAIPEVGDEVIVGFELQDKRRPIVLGGLWNRNALPHGTPIRDGMVAGRYWNSRTSHLISLVDADDENLILIRHGSENTFVKLEDSALTLETSGDGTIDCTGNVEIKGTEIRVEASSKLTLKAPQIEINADAEVKISGAIINLN